MASLEQYKMLVTVAEKKSIRLAADALHKTQPAVTNAMKKLENEFGFALFDRSGYRIQVSESGERIVELAKQLLDQAAGIKHVASVLQNGEESIIRVAIEASYNLERMVEPLQMLQQAHPNCQISLQQEYLSGAISKLMANEVDLAISPIVANLFAVGKVESKLLYQGGFVNVASPGFVAGVGSLSSIADLSNQYQILVSDSGQLTQGTNIGVQEGQRTWRVNSFESKKLLIEQGLGWGTLPKHKVEKALELGQLVALQIEDFPVAEQLEYHVIKTKHAMLGPVASKLWEQL